MGESERYAAGIICGFGLGVPHPAHKLLPGQLRPAAAGQRLLAVKLRGAVEGKVMLAPDTPAAMLLALIDLITTHSRCLAFHLESGRPLPMDGLLGACVIKSKRSLYIHVLTRPSRGDMPLLAAIKAADWEAAAALLRELPSAATEEVDAMGRLPLHAALHSKQAAPLTLLDALLHAAPKTVMLRDRTFSLPLHYALASPHTDAAFTLRLLKGFVHGTKRRDTLNRWPLHVALVKGYAASDVVLRLLHAHPTIATVKLRAGRLPLHLACLQRYDAAVIAGLLETSRDAALVADSSGALPLHYAAAAAASADVIRLLLDSADASAATADGAGRLPLHAAASAVSNAAMSEEALALLAVHHTSSAQARVTADCAGLFPIHIAIKAAAAAVSHALPHQLPLLLQQLLLPCDEDGNAAGCDWRGRQGETLLHFACQHGAPPAAIAQLLSALPHLPPPTLQTDAYGRTALHVALQQGAPLATVRLLLTAAAPGSPPADALRSATLRQAWLPLHCAVRAGSAAAVVSALLSTDSGRQAAATQDAHGRLPLALLAARRPLFNCPERAVLARLLLLVHLPAAAAAAHAASCVGDEALLQELNCWLNVERRLLAVAARDESSPLSYLPLAALASIVSYL